MARKTGDFYPPIKEDGINIDKPIITTSTNTAASYAATGADGLTQNSNKVADEFAISTELLAASVDKWVFVADRAYKVIAIKESHSVVGGTSAAVSPRKVTDTSAPGAGAGATVKELTTGAFDLTTGVAVNTSTSGTLSSTASDLILAAGDKIGLDFSGTLTGLVGSMTIYLRPV